MRQFIVLGHDAPTDSDFALDDLAGGAGRLDVLCRAVSAAVFLSHDIREDVRVSLVLDDSLTVRIEASELRYMNPDERNVAALLRSALEAKGEAIGHQEAESTPGIYISKRGFEPVLETVAREATILQLHEDGDAIATIEPPADPAFVLSDHRDFTDDEAALLEERTDHRVRLGPEILHADHAVTVVHNWLDTAGFARY
ncbi:MAG: tRNA (pseudouridine(54)-N(1))-methyltransferase TrmY [Halobacteriota archaeon]